MLSLSEIRSALNVSEALLLEAEDLTKAAVALVVCDSGSGAEVLFIERSAHEQDPWSGHLGFPGGRLEPTDPEPRSAAERETFEEIGLDLAEAEFLGRLSDLTGASQPVLISCFVFGIGSRPELAPNPAEVRDAFWFPLEELLEPGRRRERLYLFGGEEAIHPAIQLLEEGRPLLWGITYRLVCQLLEVLGRPI